MSDARHLNDRQALALTVESIISERSVASLRRDAVTRLADELLANPQIAEVVRLALLHRAKEGIGRPPLRAVGEDT